MFRALLEKRVGKLSNAELAIICEIVTDDIKFNRVHFKKLSNLDYVLNVAERSSNIFKRCA